jgi:hypothetical protein
VSGDAQRVYVQGTGWGEGMWLLLGVDVSLGGVDVSLSGVSLFPSVVSACYSAVNDVLTDNGCLRLIRAGI